MSKPTASAPGDPVAFVAGASRGLGLAIARELGSRGFRLVICARDADELARAAGDLRDRGYVVHTEVADVSDRSAVEALVTRTETEIGPIETMICVAGIIQVGPLDSLTYEHFRQAIDVMLWGPVHTATAVLPAMRARGRGQIGVITSVGGLVPAPHLLPYSTAKFGAVGFSRGLRSELTGSGVSVTTIAPGLLRTGSHGRALFVGDQEHEFAWFAAAASLPVLSMNADRAASRIVSGVLRGRANVLLTPLTHVASRVAALAPNLTAAALALTVRALPAAPPGAKPTVEPGRCDDENTIEGRVARTRLSPRGQRMLARLTVLGDKAASRLLQGALTKPAVPDQSAGSPPK